MCLPVLLKNWRGKAIPEEVERFICLPHVRKALIRLLDGMEKIEVTIDKDGKQVILKRLE